MLKTLSLALSMVMVFLIAPPAVASEMEGAEATACSLGEGTTALEGKQLREARIAALHAAETRVLQKFLVSEGFRPRPAESFGAEADDGTMAVVLPFETRGADQRGAGIAYTVSSAGDVQIEAGVFNFNDDGSVTTENFKVGDGDEIVPTNSWWSRFWRCILTTCGPGAVACKWAGPAWWQCALAVCGTSAVLCAITSN